MIQKRNVAENERIASAVSGDQVAPAFLCECQHPLCSDVAVLTLEEFRGIRERGHLVASVAHSRVAETEVVDSTARYAEIRYRS